MGQMNSTKKGNKTHEKYKKEAKNQKKLKLSSASKRILIQNYNIATKI